MTPDPTDIIVLAHNRLEHLVATVEALEERTPEPIRITIVDNASGPDVRNWLATNRHRFARVILRPTNEHVAAFQHGIDATTSDPYVVTDPDIVVPALEPSWLAQLHGLMTAHRDFGLIGIGLDQANRPRVLEPESIDPATVVDGEVVEAGVGTVMQMIRRDALVTPYRTDWRTCTDVKRAGWRVGWALGIRAVHLGWDDHRLHPAHLASKHLHYGVYREMGLLERAPTLAELALAAPAVAVTRACEVPDGSVLELTWGAPAVGAAVPASVCVEHAEPASLPFADSAAGAVVLVDPPVRGGAAMVAEASRVATRVVVAVAELAAFGAHTAADLAPAGWTGREAAGPGDVPLALAQAADADPALADRLGPQALADRERWLALFARGAFGAGRRRLWIWERDEPGPSPERVRFDPARVRPWQPVPARHAGATAQEPPARPLGPRRPDRARARPGGAATARERSARVSARVDAIVVAYRSADTLRGCVEPLAACADVRVTVVDNASPDDGLATIAGLDVQILRSARNGGFSYGCNLGAAHGSAPYLLFLNPDARIGAADVAVLKAVLEADAGTALVAPRILGFDGELAWSRRRFPRQRSTFAQALFLHRLWPLADWSDELVRDAAEYERAGEAEWVSGACMLVRRSAFEEVGGFDEGFFLYCEDTDLCRRLWDAGHAVRFEPLAEVRHVGGGSSASGETRPIAVRSRVRYARKHFRPTAARVQSIGVALGELTHATARLARLKPGA